MPNPARGEVALKAGDQTYTLSMSINAICCVEEHFDLPIASVAERLNVDNPRMGDVRAFLWATLQDHHPDMTMQDAGRLAVDGGIPAVLAALGKVLTAAFPQDDGASAEGNVRKARRAA